MADLSKTHLQVGDKAPPFSITEENGNLISLSDFKGKKLILFFYPKDNTPGCTAEVCNLRDHFSSLQKAGYSLLGASADTQRKHQNFIKKFNLPFPLLADTEKILINAYGVWGDKKFMGREYQGILRTTFVIDEKGVISKVITSVKTKDHTAQIMD